MTIIRGIFAIAVGMAAVVRPTIGVAEEYPTRSIRIVVPFPAGGGGDTVARPIAQKMYESMGQPVVVENRPGAGAMIGTNVVAQAEPDGYTLLFTFDPPHTTTPYTAAKLQYDPVKNFTPITAVVKAPQVLVVNANVPAKTLREFIELVKKNPGKINYGTAGRGTAQHFGGELLNQTAGIQMVHIPYKGTPPVITDLLAGRLDASISVLANVQTHINSGKLRALAVLESTRAKAAPDIPTMVEAGLPGYDMPATWIGLLGPAGMPKEIVARLHKETVKAANAPDIRAHLEKLGFELILNTPDELANNVAAGSKIYGVIAKKANITPE